MGRLTVAVEEKPEKVYRELELETGIALDCLEFEGGQVYRESFISNPAKVMAVQVRAERNCQRCVCGWRAGVSRPIRSGMKKDGCYG